MNENTFQMWKKIPGGVSIAKTALENVVEIGLMHIFCFGSGSSTNFGLLSVVANDHWPLDHLQDHILLLWCEIDIMEHLVAKPPTMH